MHAAFAVWCNLWTSETRHKQTCRTHLSNSNDLGQTLFPSRPGFCYMDSATNQPAVCGPRQAGIECCFGGSEVQEESSWSARSPSNTNNTSTLQNCAHPESQRKDGSPLRSLLQSSTASHSDNMCLPASCLSRLTHRDNPKAFLWVYEGLAVACGLPEEEAGREQTSSDCTLEQHRFIRNKSILHPLCTVLFPVNGLDMLGVCREECNLNC